MIQIIWDFDYKKDIFHFKAFKILLEKGCKYFTWQNLGVPIDF